MEKPSDQIYGHRSRRRAENGGCQKAAANPFLTGAGHSVATQKRNLKPGRVQSMVRPLERQASAHCHGIILRTNGHDVGPARCGKSKP